jgi:hypothetical protein
MNTKTIIAALIITLLSAAACDAYPYCGGGYGYRGGYCGGNRGWYNTGIPNGLGWTLFGLGAAGALAGGAAWAAQPPVVVAPPGGYYAPNPAPQVIYINR